MKSVFCFGFFDRLPVVKPTGSSRYCTFRFPGQPVEAHRLVKGFAGVCAADDSDFVKSIEAKRQYKSSDCAAEHPSNMQFHDGSEFLPVSPILQPEPKRAALIPVLLVTSIMGWLTALILVVLR